MTLLYRQINALRDASALHRSTQLKGRAEVQRQARTEMLEAELPPERLATRMVLAKVTGDVFFKERFIGEVDLLPANFLERGAMVARSVCRLEIKDAFGRLDGYATGVLVGGSLLLTNHHVLPSVDDARRSIAHFDYADDARGEPLPAHAFRLEPERFFCTDGRLDYSFVAVAPTSLDGASIVTFGASTPIFTPGKTILSEHLNVVQHPSGQSKQIAIRHNDLTEQTPDFLLYEADTNCGSSGSPVYNDAWAIVALHAAGVPKQDERGRFFDKRTGKIIEGQPSSLDDVEFIANRGVRISRIYEDLKTRADLAEADRRLVLSVFRSIDEVTAGGALALGAAGSLPSSPTPIANPPSGARPTAPSPAAARTMIVERLSADRYAGCTGFDEAFLGLPVPLPKLTAAMRADAAPVNGRHDGVLDYTHFSLVMSKSRKLAFFTACNIDGAQSRRLHRSGKDVWYIDGRIDEAHQTNDVLYARNRIDRGHLVRREDPVWGEQAAQANAQTFHFTNCSPQHEAFNQRTWLELEDYILETVRDERIRASVFTGPVFGEQDLEYRGVKIPEQFWKVVVTNDAGKLRAAAYIESQRDLMSDLEFAFGTFKTYRVPITRVEEATGLDFGKLREADTMNEGTGEVLDERAAAASVREVIDPTREVF